MGSVISDTICKYCGYENAMLDFNYKSMEESVFCTRCGSSYGNYIEKSILNNGEIEYEYRTYDRKSNYLCCYGNTFQSLGELSKENIKDFAKFVQDNITQLTVGYYTFRKNGKWFVKDVITKKVTLFEEYEGVNNENIQ